MAVSIAAGSSLNAPMDPLDDLLDLQAVDLDIDRLLDRRQSLPEIGELESVRADLRSAEEARDEKAGEMRTTSLGLDKAEGELEILERRLAESETRLYAGGMSSRETENKRLEVQSLRSQQSVLEEKVLGLFDEKDRLDAELSAADRLVASAAEEEERLKSIVAAAWKEIDLEIGRREGRKAGLVPAIPPALLGLYEELRKTKHGVSVGRLEAGQCGGCHLHLSSTEQREAAETDPPRCVHCRRILVL